MTQREDDISASLAGMKEALNLGEFEHSGGQIHAFREGWATDVWVFGKAHYWRRSPSNLAYVRSLCGVVTLTKSMYGEGNIPRCKRCVRARQ